MEIEICIELEFIHEKGYSFWDATAKTLKEAERIIREEKKRGWKCTRRAIGVYKNTEIFEREQLAWQEI